MRPKKASNLIDLLLVIAIITILIALLLPALARAGYEGACSNCQGQPRQVAVAAINNSVEARGRLPYNDFTACPNSASPGSGKYLRNMAISIDSRPPWWPGIDPNQRFCPVSPFGASMYPDCTRILRIDSSDELWAGSEAIGGETFGYIPGQIAGCRPARSLSSVYRLTPEPRGSKGD